MKGKQTGKEIQMHWGRIEGNCKEGGDKDKQAEGAMTEESGRITIATGTVLGQKGVWNTQCNEAGGNELNRDKDKGALD
jgi:hypothetical protein